MTVDRTPGPPSAAPAPAGAADCVFRLETVEYDDGFGVGRFVCSDCGATTYRAA